MKSNFLLIASCVLMTTYFSCRNTRENQLTMSQKAEGFKSLFDGKTLDGWRGYQDKSTASWFVDNGTIHCKGSDANYGAITADLITEETYDNFDFQVDYKISPKGNSGILYMVNEDHPYSHESGPEYQIIDDVNFPEKLETWQLTAANYAMNAAPDAKPNPAGQWNHARIIKNGKHVEHWLNGQKVVEYELYSDDWKKRKEEGKWKDVAAYATNEKGHITFQNHGSEAWFKNIMIRELP